MNTQVHCCYFNWPTTSLFTKRIQKTTVVH